MRISLRQLILALVVIGIVGLEIELALLDHADSFSQLIPHFTLILGLVTTFAVYLRPGKGSLRVFQLVMALFLVIGLVGVVLHFRGNIEFAAERHPELSGMLLWWEALRGATPALAPGALAQLGLLGLLYTYGHPALAKNQHEENVS